MGHPNESLFAAKAFCSRRFFRKRYDAQRLLREVAAHIDEGEAWLSRVLDDARHDEYVLSAHKQVRYIFWSESRNRSVVQQ